VFHDDVKEDAVSMLGKVVVTFFLVETVEIVENVSLAMV